MTGADLQATAFVLAVPDADATADWWAKVMGFEEILRVPGWAFVRRGACVLRLGSCPGALAPKDLGDHSYFGYVTVGAEIIFAPADQPGAFARWACAPPTDTGSCSAKGSEARKHVEMALS